MSQGRQTQTWMNSITWATAAGGVLFLILFFVLNERELAYGMIVVLLLVSLPYYLMKCRQCGHHVAKDAEGNRVRGAWPPRVNAQCANCGADIP